MFHQVDLRALAEKNSADRAFLSLYIKDRDGLKRLASRIRSMETLLAAQPDEADHLKENLKLVEDWLAANKKQTGPLCLFACWLEDYLKVIPLAVAPPKEEILLDSSPYIRPLAEMQDEYETFAVVAADNKAARIHLVASATAIEDEKIKGNIKNHVRVGGWSQQRYERRRDKDILHYAKEVAEALAELEKNEPFQRLILVGGREAIDAIEKQLPKHLADKLVGDKVLDLKQGEQSINQEIFDLFFEEERRDEAALWKLIRNRSLSGGLAVTGIQPVLDSVQQGRVEQVLVNRGLQAAGMRCRQCETLFLPADNCPGCGSQDLFEVDLVNEIVELLAKTSAAADFCDPIPGLSEVGGIGALLRY